MRYCVHDASSVLIELPVRLIFFERVTARVHVHIIGVTGARLWKISFLLRDSVDGVVLGLRRPHKAP